MSTGQTLLVALTVDGNVLQVAALELLDGGLNVLHATLLTHLLGREVGVETGTVPVTGHGLGVDRDLGAELLSDAVEEETGEPEVVTHLNTLAGADLELPLGGHDLGVGTGDLDASVQALHLLESVQCYSLWKCGFTHGLVVSLDDISLDDLASTNTTVVRTLGSGETSGGPAEGAVVEVEESVLLLKTEPGLVSSVGLHQLGGLVSVVELVGGAIGHPALGEDQNVVVQAERIREDGDGAQVDIRVVAGSLASRGTVKVPDGQVLGGVTTVLGGERLERKLSAHTKSWE